MRSGTPYSGDDAPLRVVQGEAPDARRRRPAPRPCSTTRASGRSPHLSSGTPITATSLTPGCWQDDVLELQRGDPLAAGLDDVLDAVRDLQVALRVDEGDVAGVQVAAGPELPESARVLEVALGQPGGAHDDLAGGLAVVGHVAHLLVDDAQVHERDGPPGAAADLQLALVVQVRSSPGRAGPG